MDIHITRAVVDDAAVISALMRPLAEQYIVHEFPNEARQRLLASMSAEGILRLLQSDYHYFLAHAGTTLAGVIGIRQCTHLYHLFVAQGFQRQGIARQLWHTAVEACREDGVHGEFTVNASRLAVPFYERLGFVPSGDAETRHGIISFPMHWMPSNVSSARGGL